MYNKNEKKSENWKNWIAIFTVGLLLILVYKLLDNFTQIGEWIGTLFSVLTPFLVGLLIAYLLYMPCRGLENLYKKTKKKNFINYCGLLGVAAFISYGFVEIKPLKVGGRISIEANCCMECRMVAFRY